MHPDWIGIHVGDLRLVHAHLAIVGHALNVAHRVVETAKAVPEQADHSHHPEVPWRVCTGRIA